MSKKDKIRYPVTSPKGMTRPGTKPNKSGKKLVCIQNTYNADVKRISAIEASKLVGLVDSSWVYCPKSAWKKFIAGGVQSVQE